MTKDELNKMTKEEIKKYISAKSNSDFFEALNLIDIKNFIEYKYFQVYFEGKNPNPELPPYCNVLSYFYKGIYIGELYLDDIEEAESIELINLHPQKRKKFILDNFELFGGGWAENVVLDDNYYPKKVLSRKDMYKEIYDI
ncbi:MAG: hypothetical protein RR620_08730 [Clostridium sp.]